jgi:hypothetical protein
LPYPRDLFFPTSVFSKSNSVRNIHLCFLSNYFTRFSCSGFGSARELKCNGFTFWFFVSPVLSVRGSNSHWSTRWSNLRYTNREPSTHFERGTNILTPWIRLALLIWNRNH